MSGAAGWVGVHIGRKIGRIKTNKGEDFEIAFITFIGGIIFLFLSLKTKETIAWLFTVVLLLLSISSLWQGLKKGGRR